MCMYRVRVVVRTQPSQYSSVSWRGLSASCFRLWHHQAAHSIGHGVCSHPATVACCLTLMPRWVSQIRQLSSNKQMWPQMPNTLSSASSKSAFVFVHEHFAV